MQSVSSQAELEAPAVTCECGWTKNVQKAILLMVSENGSGLVNSLCQEAIHSSLYKPSTLKSAINFDKDVGKNVATPSFQHHLLF